MQSKTLCFNRTLFRKNLTRFWPLWAVPSFVGALFPLAMLTQLIQYGVDGLLGTGLQTQNYPLEFTSIYYSVVVYAIPIISLCYAILVAIAMWSYLFNHRSTGLMHTLPIRREGLFLTNFLSGMTMMLVPYVVTGALCILISMVYGFFEPVGVLLTILGVIGESFFYFSSATVVAFITGNLVALPVLYFIFHFLAVGMDQMISVFAGGFLFGLRGDYTGVVEYLSPTVYLMSHVNVNHEYEEVFVPGSFADGIMTPDGYGHYESNLVSVTLENAWIIAVYALVAVVLLGVAWALYRKRRSECAGDVVAVGWMKPVFRYGVAVCSSMLGGLGLYLLFWQNFQGGSYYDVIPLLIAMLIAGAIGYYTASMLLAKSLRVFRGSWKGLGATALCAVAICCVLKFDLFGVETRVPSVDQIEYMTLYTADNNYTLYPEEDSELIEEIRTVHLAIAEDADYVKAMDENWRYTELTEENVSMNNSFRVSYYLENGTRVIRRYYVPVSQDRLTQEGTYDYALDRLVNSDAMKAERFHLEDGYQPESGYLYVDTWTNGSVSFGTKEARVIHEAVRQDVASGTCGNYSWFDSNRANQYAMDLSLEFEVEETTYGGDTHTYYDSISIAVYPEMTHTVAALEELGLVAEQELKTYMELYPQEYDEAYWEYQEKFGAALDYEDYLVMRGEAASIGVIGGADGPTQIMVAAG